MSGGGGGLGGGGLGGGGGGGVCGGSGGVSGAGGMGGGARGIATAGQLAEKTSTPFSRRMKNVRLDGATKREGVLLHGLSESVWQALVSMQ